ncbi:MAG: PAS domain S-box protein [Anaerolineae bacterium]|nr:PAS domain S-box protein [Anaerolineae bacterium]
MTLETPPRHDSNELYQVLFEQAADGIFIADANGRYIEVNRRGCEMLGYTRTEILSLSMADLIPEEDQGPDPLEIEAIRAGKNVLKERRLRGQDGRLLPVEISTHRLTDGRFLEIVHDISEQKKAAERLRHTTQELQRVTTSISDYLWSAELDEDGNWSHNYYSPVVEKITGYPPQFFLENPERWLSTVYPDDQPRLLTALQRIISRQSEREEEEYRTIRPDGTLCWVRDSVIVTQLAPDHLRVDGVVSDITERRRAEDELRASEARFRTFVDHATDAFFLHGDQGIILDVNRQACESLGYTREELIGMSPYNFDPGANPAFHEQLRIRMNAGEVVEFESTHRRKDGTVFPVEVRIRPFWQGDRQLRLSLARDITERKKLEAENKQLTAQFYHAQKMESIGQLAGGIAHEFNNLLVPIIGYIELNLAALDPTSQLYADLTVVIKAANRAADLTRQIVAFSRQQLLELSLLDLNSVIANFQRMLQRLIGEDIQLQTVLGPDVVLVKADQSQIEQVIMNLVINARDAMPTGGKLTIETTNAFLDETYVKKHTDNLAPGPYVMLAISDTGHGIDAATQKRIFDPFFTTKAQGQGTGLGLATVFGIIKQHQGHIMVYSKPDHGATFKIYFPKVEEVQQTVDSSSPQPASMFGTETVLVVEDEELVRQLVCETLEAHGYDVIEAQSPADGLQLASNQSTIHLLVTDVIMPEMNGKEVYHKVAALHPTCKVLYMSGYTNKIIGHRGILDAGINFLQKPFTVHNLVGKVRTVLS